MQTTCPAHTQRAWLRGARSSLILIVLLSLPACTPFWSKNAHQESERRAVQLQELQLKVMRYSDEYSGALADPLARFSAQAVSPEERLLAQTWRLSQATAAYTIASGPNPVVNTLDMIVLATLSRMVLEDPEVRSFMASVLQRFCKHIANSKHARGVWSKESWTSTKSLSSKPSSKNGEPCTRQ